MGVMGIFTVLDGVDRGIHTIGTRRVAIYVHGYNLVSFIFPPFYAYICTLKTEHQLRSATKEWEVVFPPP